MNNELKAAQVNFQAALLNAEVESMKVAGHYDEDAFMRVAAHYKTEVETILLPEVPPQLADITLERDKLAAHLRYRLAISAVSYAEAWADYPEGPANLAAAYTELTASRVEHKRLNPQDYP
jgi:hypothetical protein